MSDVPNIRLMRDLILVEHDDSEEKERLSKGGVVLPGGSYVDEGDIMTWGIVVGVGPGRMTSKGVLVPLEVKVGDKVCYNRFNRKTQTGEQLEQIIGEKYVILEERKDIVAVDPA